MIRTIQRLLALAAAGFLLAGTVGAGTAAAASPRAAAVPTARAGVDRCAALRVTALAQPTVANLQALGRCEIDGRLAALARLQAAVDASAALTDAHEAALDSILSSTVARLRALRTEIDGDTTVEAVREDIRRIYVELGVYALVARQVGLVIAADRAAVAADRLSAAAGRLEAAINQAEASGKNVGDARRHLATMTAQVAVARAAAAGVAAPVLALTPAAWTAGDARPVLRRAQADLRDGLVATAPRRGGRPGGARRPALRSPPGELGTPG